MLSLQSEDLSDRPSRLPISFTGWALKALLFDAELLRFVMTASALRRQAIFMILAIADLADFVRRCRATCPSEDWRGDDDNDLALALRKWRVQRLLSLVCDGYIPHGLTGVLGRAGHAPLMRRSYLLMLDLLAAGDERAKILIGARTISDLKIVAASKLDLALCQPGVLDRIALRQTVDGINAVAVLARELADADDQALADSVSPTPTNWSRWATLWAEKVRRFPAMSVVPDGFVALNSAASMKDAAGRFGNCLASRIPQAVVGRRAYLEYGPGQAIIELEALSGAGWLLSGIHGPNNDALDPMTFTEIVTKLRRAGVLIPSRIDENHERRAAARILDAFDFDEATTDPVLEDLLAEARLRVEQDA